MYGVPPFGYNYLSPAPPLFAHAVHQLPANGAQNTDPFPLQLPAAQRFREESVYAVSILRAVTPISADPYFYYRNSVPYTRKLHVFDSAPDHARMRC